ncbi:redoxin domain-containing protein [Teredinibacter franksiae]|uniref:redoxin domain-containing protein n=1 Tax=Teredinibacter franksiae TaxID=2761453 RepID=UPI001C89254E|nr:redoxin domain-containing protein [Teredinibacter franksiae]
MRKIITPLLAGLLLSFALPIAAKPVINQPAPEFAAKDANGNMVALASLKGKTVILEWTNHECPFVRKHYDSSNMQSLQKQFVNDDTVWLTIISSAEGKQGFVSGTKANALAKDRSASPSYTLIDASGDVGRAYAAKTTPHMYIIDAAGVLRYMGGIDSIRSADPADIPKATNYISQAMSELAAGKPVSQPVTKAYGCSVKY